jgi:hypothetical protein
MRPLRMVSAAPREPMAFEPPVLYAVGAPELISSWLANVFAFGGLSGIADTRDG